MSPGVVSGDTKLYAEQLHAQGDIAIQHLQTGDSPVVMGDITVDASVDHLVHGDIVQGHKITYEAPRLYLFLHCPHCNEGCSEKGLVLAQLLAELRSNLPIPDHNPSKNP